MHTDIKGYAAFVSIALHYIINKNCSVFAMGQSDVNVCFADLRTAGSEPLKFAERI
jgi:hypothetical protein